MSTALGVDSSHWRLSRSDATLASNADETLLLNDLMLSLMEF